MTDQRIRALFLMTGLGAGILVGGFFAPRAGEDSRKLFRRKALRAKKAVQNAVDDGAKYMVRGEPKCGIRPVSWSTGARAFIA